MIKIRFLKAKLIKIIVPLQPLSPTAAVALTLNPRPFPKSRTDRALWNSSSSSKIDLIGQRILSPQSVRNNGIFPVVFALYILDILRHLHSNSGKYIWKEWMSSLLHGFSWIKMKLEFKSACLAIRRSRDKSCWLIF